MESLESLQPLMLAVRAAYTNALASGTPEVHEKGALDEYTSYDVSIEKELIAFIEREYPRCTIVSEELNPDRPLGCYSDFFVIDPIDGTKNFSHGDLWGIWGIQLAHVARGEVQSAIIYHPTRNEMYYAVKGQGAYLETANGTRRLPPVTPRPIRQSILGICGLSPSPERLRNQLCLIKQIRGAVESIRIAGATCATMTACAVGAIDGVTEWYSKIWDYLPGVLICREVGAEAYNFLGQPYVFGDRFFGVFTSQELMAACLNATPTDSWRA